MNRLYQWLLERASFFRSCSSAQGKNRTIRTEVMVKQEGTTLVMCGTVAGLDVCPLCGHTLGPAQMQQVTARFQQVSISQETVLPDPPHTTGGSSAKGASPANNDTTQTARNLALRQQGELNERDKRQFGQA